MEKPSFSIERFNDLQTNKQKAYYLRDLASKLDAYDAWLTQQEDERNQAMEAHLNKWLTPSLEKLRKKYIGDETTVEKDKNGKTVIKTNGTVTGVQG